MASIKLTGDTSGEITISAPAVAGTNTLTLPANTGTILTSESGAGDLPSTIAGPAFSARITSNQNISNNTATKVELNADEFDLTNDFDITNYKFTPSVEGYYQFNLSVFINGGNLQGMFRGELYKNGNVYKRTTMQADSISTDLSASGSLLVYANGSTDYFEMYVYHNLGSTRELFANSTLTFFQGCLIRAT